jgi:hypothetical protein
MGHNGPSAADCVEAQGRQEPDMGHINEVLEQMRVPDYVDRAVADAYDDQGRRGVVRCWEHRGCEGLMGLTKPMMEECPHNRDDCLNPCPNDCRYTVCSRAWHRQTADFDLLFDETVDRRAAIKKTCLTCAHFLRHGPRVGERDDYAVVPETATSRSTSSSTIHMF